jgi:membrane associated rhomboid family serine protease
MLYLVIGILFPSLSIAFVYLWLVPMMLFKLLRLPPAIMWGAHIVGVVASLAAAFWCCREVWRRRPRRA